MKDKNEEKPAATRQDVPTSGGKQAGPPQSEGLGGEEKPKEETKEEKKDEGVDKPAPALDKEPKID